MKIVKDMKKSAEVLRRFARFNLVGTLGIAVQLTGLWVLVDVWGVAYPLATAAAVALAVVHNFVWHQRWTWGDRHSDRSATVLAFVRFAGTNGVISIVGNVAIMLVLVDAAGAHPLIAAAIAIATCGLINFAMNDLFVFQA
jgi:putative flippase GtrA